MPKISTPTKARFIGNKTTWYKIEKDPQFYDELIKIEDSLKSQYSTLYNSYISTSHRGKDKGQESLFETNTKPKLVNIHNRRYLGNKYKLLNFIENVVKIKCGNFKSLLDIFAGTGVVGNKFNSKDTKIISNDILVSNYFALKTFLTITLPLKSITKKIQYLNNLNPSDDNYFSEHFGGTFFSIENARKIGLIRESIDKIAEDENEKSILLTALLYATDKVANTVGHYDAFRKKLDSINPVILKEPLIDYSSNSKNEVYNLDANELISNINVDILYIDPPYNSRQYSDAYHLLENLTTWKKPIVEGIARKMDRKHIKSDYCTSKASKAFEDLISKAQCKHIIVSYNNTGGSKDGRSNAKITDIELTEILKQKGKVEIFESNYKAFTTGKSNVDNHTERLFYCQVKP